MIDRARRLKPALLILLLLFVSSVLLLFTGCGSSSTSVDPPKVFEYNKPGTVYLETVWQADVTVTDVTVSEKAITDWALKMVSSGQFNAATSEDEMVAAFIEELLTNPQKYIVPGTGIRSLPGEQTAASGSGFIITPDGYAVTNAHVVKMNDDELKQAMALTALNDLVQGDISDLETALGTTLTQDQSDKMAQALASAYAQYLTVSNESSQSQLFMGVTVPGLGVVQKGLAVEIVKVGEPSPGKDVAILKVNADNLPTVPLGDDTAVKEGDQAIAIGYPGAATFNPLIEQSQENIKPSLTTGSVSGRKTMPGGWEVLQIDTPVTHGNSGGPLFNSKGEVIGITTFGSVNQNSQGQAQEVQGFNFAVPTTIVKQFLQESNITPSQGMLTKNWHDAVDLSANSHYSAAKDQFNEIQDSNPGYPYVNEEIATCTAQINAGNDKSTFPTWVVIIPIVIILIIVVALVLFLLLRKKKPKGPGAAGPMGPGMTPRPGAPGPVPPQPQAPGPIPPQPPQPPVGAPPVPPVPPAAAPPTAPPPAAAPPAPEAPAPEPAAPAPPEQPAPEAPGAGEVTTEMPAPGAAPAPGAPPAVAPEEGAAGAGQEEAPHFCANCGHAIPGDAKFCPNCAKPIQH